MTTKYSCMHIIIEVPPRTDFGNKRIWFLHINVPNLDVLGTRVVSIRKCHNNFSQLAQFEIDYPKHMYLHATIRTIHVTTSVSTSTVHS